MADTLPNIDIPIKTWVNLYAESGIAVGEMLQVQNLGDESVYLYEGATPPSEVLPINLNAYRELPKKEQAYNQHGASGAWAYTANNPQIINVQQVGWLLGNPDAASTGATVKSEIVDSLGNQVEVGVFGGLKIADPNAQIQMEFARPIVFGRTADLISGAPQSQYNGTLARCLDGDAFSTIRQLRYIAGQTIETYFTAQFIGTFDTGGGDTFIGLFNDISGVFMGYRGADFVVGYRNVRSGADVVQIVDEPNPSFLTRFRIRFGYLGVGNIAFEKKIGSNPWEAIHVFDTDGALDARTHIGSTVIPMRMQCGHVNGEIITGSWSATTYGRDTGIQEIDYFTRGQRDIANNATPQPFAAFRIKATEGAYPTQALIELIAASFATTSEGISRIVIHGAPDGSITTGAWRDASPLSVLEVNDTFTDTLPAAAVAVSSVVLAVGSQGRSVSAIPADLSRFESTLRPNRMALVYKEQIFNEGGTDTVSYDINYAELS